MRKQVFKSVLKRITVFAVILILILSTVVLPSSASDEVTYDLGLRPGSFGPYMPSTSSVWMVDLDATYTAALLTKDPTATNKKLQLFSKLNSGSFGDFELSLKLCLGEMTEWWHGVDFYLRDNVQLCFHKDGYITLYAGPDAHANVVATNRIKENYQDTWHNVHFSFYGSVLKVTVDSTVLMNYDFAKNGYTVNSSGAIYVRHEGSASKIAKVTLKTDLDSAENTDIQNIASANHSFLKAISDVSGSSENVNWRNYCWRAEYTDANMTKGTWGRLIYTPQVDRFTQTGYNDSQTILFLDSDNRLVIGANRWGEEVYYSVIAAAYLVPQTDSYRISCSNIEPASANDLQGGGSIRLTLNNVQIWPEGDSWAAVNHDEETIFPAMDLDLAKGDVLRFEVMSGKIGVPNPNGVHTHMTLNPRVVIKSDMIDDVASDSEDLMDCEDQNILSGLVAKTNYISGGKNVYTAATENLSALTDGMSWTTATSDFDLSKSKNIYFDSDHQTFTFDMEQSVVLDRIQVIGSQNKNEYLNNYSLYVGNSEYDLYSDENLFYEYDVSNFGNATRNQVVSFKKTPSGRFLGLRVNSCGLESNFDSMKPRISEVVANGYVLGDCDNDKSLNANDLVIMRKGILDLVTLKKSADTTRDDHINIKDLIRLKKTILEAQNKEVSNEINTISPDPLSVSDKVFHEQYRPQVHYSNEFGWASSRCGLIYYEGEYHMFYVHNAEANVSGASSWGHAVSKDLMHWEELPDAILRDSENAVWSGSCVVDQNDTTGFFNGSSGLVALFTNADLATGTKYSVGLAYSSDKGRTWTKVAEPVLTPDENSNFQNPTVFWHEETQKWICVIAGGPMRIYSSDNLKDWTFESKNNSLWAQSPDFYEIPVEGTNESKWVFSISGVGYVVGEFDGKTFTPTQSSITYDKSPDRYNAKTFNNMPDGRRVEIDWMGTWDYSSKLADVLPGNGVATIPVELKLVKDGDQYKIERDFVEELDYLRGDKIFEAHSGVLTETSNNPFENIEASTLDLNVRFKPSENAVVKYAFNAGTNEEVMVSYDVNTKLLSIDRTKLPLDVAEMKNVYTATVLPDENGFVDLRILLDWTGIEVVANGGENLLSALYFPNPNAKGIEMSVTGGSCLIDSMEAYRMNSMRKSLKILSIGNSFSVDSQEYLYNIATDLGYTEVVLGNLYIGGCPLEKHLECAQNDLAEYTYYYNDSGTWEYYPGYKMSTALKSQDWDYITVQQASASVGLANTYDDLDPLLDIVKTMSGDAKFAWNMTWAFQKDYQWGFGVYETQENMYQQITSAVKSKIATRDDFYAIIPNGTAIQNARTSYLGDTLTRDGSHLSLDAGRYIAALNFFHTLTGESIDSIQYAPEGVNAKKKATCIESVNNSHKSPFAVTDSTYKTIDMLFIGNSMTYVNDVPGTLAMLAAKNGIIINQKQVVVGGRSLIEHVNDGTALNEIRSGKYDNVCVQEQQAIIDSQSAREDCLKALDILSEETYKANADFHVYLRASKEVEHYGISPLEQSKTMDEFLTPAAQSRNATCIYANRAITIANQTLDFNLWYDGLHHTTHGSYLVVCTFYATYFNRSATELDTAYDLPVEDAKKLQKIADQVVFEGKIPW